MVGDADIVSHLSEFLMNVCPASPATFTNVTRFTKLLKNGSCAQTHRSVLGWWITTLGISVSLTEQERQILCHFHIHLL